MLLQKLLRNLQRMLTRSRSLLLVWSPLARLRHDEARKGRISSVGVSTLSLPLCRCSTCRSEAAADSLRI